MKAVILTLTALSVTIAATAQPSLKNAYKDKAPRLTAGLQFGAGQDLRITNVEGASGLPARVGENYYNVGAYLRWDYASRWGVQSGVQKNLLPSYNTYDGGTMKRQQYEIQLLSLYYFTPRGTALRPYIGWGITGVVTQEKWQQVVQTSTGYQQRVDVVNSFKLEPTLSVGLNWQVNKSLQINHNILLRSRSGYISPSMNLGVGISLW